ncbi:MAG: CHRD domain-containing protein [bacterium]
MRSRIIFGTLAVVGIGSFLACGSDSTSTPVQATTYTSVLNGNNEVPVRATTATGTATYTLTGNILSYVVTVNGLTGPATLSHIHVGSSAIAGPVIVPFVTASVASGNVTSGQIDLSQPISNGTTTITGDSMRVLLNNGQAYTNVHTVQFGAGEIRGQIVKQ